jgi:general secretion pathway protein K
MVRGVSDDFWSNFIEPDPKNPARRNVTIWGSGKINVNTANPMTLLAFICGAAAPTPKICLDPLETAKFLSLMNLMSTFTSGAPIFGTPQFFLDALAQKNFMGMFLQKFGLEPITVASASEAKKALSTESKVFTLIATGRVKSGQRDARVQIRTVVDFRAAPSPAQLLTNVAAAANGGQVPPGLQAPATPPPAGTPGAPGALGLGAVPTDLSGTALPCAGYQQGVVPANMPAGTTADGFICLLMANPAGRIVYFRID